MPYFKDLHRSMAVHLRLNYNPQRALEETSLKEAHAYMRGQCDEYEALVRVWEAADRRRRVRSAQAKP